MEPGGWQDVVIGAGGAVFVLALIPSLLAPTSPAVLTSGTYVVVLLAFAVSYATLGLLTAAAITTLTALAWLGLLIQGLRARG